jgi:RNA polymerase sigma-70 factor (ECF subfamily)
MQRDHAVDPRDADVHALCEAGDLDRAATEALRRYGGEILGFLLALSRGDEDSAGDVFSVFSEQLWLGLRGFAWACSLRTWAYAVARNAFLAYHRAARRRAQRAVSLSGCPAVAEMAARVRTETLSCLRTERRRELDRLREELSEEDQTLLILRVDRDLPWLDLARIFLGDEASPDQLQREAARLRKRFQLIKRRLLELVRKRGLLPQREG